MQSLLATVAFYSWYEAQEIGNKELTDNGTYLKELPNGDYESVGTSVAVSTGYIGGSLAMGLICSVCIIMIVWIEVNKKPQS